MPSRNATWISGLLALLLTAPCGQTQTATESALHLMSQQAGIIFAGQVSAVRRHDGINGTSGVVEIEFAVDNAIRGISSSVFILREWGGLWPAGDQPFRVGQHFLMLLHTPSSAGLSSPIGGSDGAIPIRGSAQAGSSVDLRWIATQAVQPALYQPPSIVHPIGGPVTLHPNAVASSPGLEVPVADIPAEDKQTEDLKTILALLRAWERAGHATR